MFSRSTQLEGILNKRYKAFFKDFFERYSPVGAIEVALVQKLASLFLRHERLVIAESAQSKLDGTYLEWDQRFKDVQELGEASRVEYKGQSSQGFMRGFLYRTENPEMRDKCLECLAGITAALSTADFDLDLVSMLLARVYGGYASGQKAYLKKLELERTTPCPNKDAFLEELCRIGAQLISETKAQQQIEASRFEYKRLSLLVPDSSHVDRFIRYETHLSREFDRTLNRLERLQRERLGLPSPPTVKVEVT
jgi:hypothetical protein